jgi:hypothetical protein
MVKGGIVQWLEQWNHTPHAVGSNPSSVFMRYSFFVLVAQLDRVSYYGYDG